MKKVKIVGIWETFLGAGILETVQMRGSGKQPVCGDMELDLRNNQWAVICEKS